MSDDGGTVTPMVRERRRGSMRPPTRQATSPQSLARHAKAEEVLRLRSAGLSYRRIGTELGVDPSTACRMVQALLAERGAERVDELRAIEGDRLDRLQAALWPDATGRDVTPENRARAASAILRLMERRARLYGLDAPQQVTITDDVDAQIIALADSVRARVIPGEVV